MTPVSKRKTVVVDCLCADYRIADFLENYKKKLLPSPRRFAKTPLPTSGEGEIWGRILLYFVRRNYFRRSFRETKGISRQHKLTFSGGVH